MKYPLNILLPALLIGTLVFTASPGSPAMAQEHPTPTIRYCHVCDEDLPQVTPTPEATAMTQRQDTAIPQTAEIVQPSGQTRVNGFTLAIVVLAGMVLSLLYVLGRLLYGVIKDAPITPIPAWQDWLIPLLCGIGLGVAAYLSYIEITLAPAICGPVGDCNSVQQSEYARLWGVLPIGVLGMAGYIAILLGWWIGRRKCGRISSFVPMALFGMTFFGTVFSGYLTYLEPFVIKAVCIWCISSAILITLLMLLSIRPALKSLIGDPHVEETTE